VDEEVVEEVTEDYSSRLAAVVDLAESAVQAMEDAIQMASNGIVWDKVEPVEVVSALDDLEIKANKLAKIIAS
jgi:Ethanolamine utilization protein EutJ (predicted chaperonin)